MEDVVGRLASLAQRQDELPNLMAGLHEGQLSLGVAATAARVCTDDNEPAVAELARCCTPSQLSRVLSAYRSADPTPAEEPDRRPEPEPATWWRCWQDGVGRGRIDAALDPGTTALLQQAWEAARAAGEVSPTADGRRVSGQREPGPDADHRPSLDERNRHADVNEVVRRLASTMLDAANDSGRRDRGGERFGVLVSIDVETLAGVLGLEWDPSLPTRLGRECFDMRTGRHLGDDEVATILCDARIQVLVHHDGAPLWLSNETRTANRVQRRALRFRAGGTGGCEYPGCTQTHFLDAHHVRHHSCGGCTDPANMVLLCGWHHRRLHQQQWGLEAHPDQTFTFRDRHGTVLGSSTARGSRSGHPPAGTELPQVVDRPDPPPRIDGDTPRSVTRGEPLTPYALDVYLSKLLVA